MIAKPKRVAILITSPRQNYKRDYETPFIDHMSELGWVEGHGGDIVYDRVYAASHLVTDEDRKKFAARVMRRKEGERPDVVWLLSTATARAALDARKDAAQDETIPIVGSALSSVIEQDIKKAENVAAIINCGWELGPRRLEFLHGLFPELRRVAVLVDKSNPSSRSEFDLLKKKSKQELLDLDVKSGEEIERELGRLKKDKSVHAVLTTHIPLFQNNRAEILRLTREAKLPLVGHRTFFVEDGALMAYSSVLRSQMRRSAEMVNIILRKKIGALKRRVERPTTFELAINLKSRQAASVRLPKALATEANREFVLLRFTESDCPV